MEPQGLVGGLVRPSAQAIVKSFEELTEKEQIQRLREELVSARYMYKRISELEKEINKLKHHQHGVNGEVLVSALYSDSNSQVAASSYDRLK